MEEAVVYLLAAFIWFVWNIVKQVRTMKENRPGTEPRPQPAPQPGAPQQRQGRPAPPRAPQNVAPQGRPAPPLPPAGGDATAPPPPPAPPQHRPVRPEQVLEEIFRQQFGLEPAHEPEPVVVGEHQRTASEHVQTADERQVTASEHVRSRGEHRQTRDEISWSAGEHQRTLGEHIGTYSEHIKGDVRGPIDKAIAVRRRTRGNRRLIRSLRRDLQHSDSLAKAWILRELLNPPIGLRSPDEQGS